MSSDMNEARLRAARDEANRWHAETLARDQRIEALEGEVVKLLGLQAEDQQSITDLKAYIRQADARAERLRAVLVTLSTDTNISQEERKFHARKALEGDKQ